MIGASGSSSGVGSSWSFGLLGTNASRALIQDRSHSFELGDPINMLVCLVKVVVTGMAQALMPKKALSGSSNGMYRGVGLDIFMEGKRVKGLRERSKLLSNRSQFRLLVGKDIVESGIVTGSGKLLISGENLGGGGVCGKWKDESISVAFPMFQNAMNNNVLGFAKFVTGKIVASRARNDAFFREELFSRGGQKFY